MAKKEKRTIVQDVHRLTIETCRILANAFCAAEKELQGDKELTDIITESKMFCDCFTLNTVLTNRLLSTASARLPYHKMKYGELLKELYQRMQTYHHYGACHGRELSGISWKEENERFVLRLGECALNMEHSILDEKEFNKDTLMDCTKEKREYRARLFAIGFDPDVDCESGERAGHYEDALNFCAEFKDEDGNVECRDVQLVNVWHHSDLLCDILAQLDMIGEIANKNINNKNNEKRD